MNVAEFLGRHGLPNTVGIVAISGGPDSVALAHACACLLREGRIAKLVLAHVNHQLRSKDSDDDEAFVHQLPAAWQMDDARLSCQSRRIDIAALARTEGENLENVARRERYRWFAELARAERAHWVATGHTADDQAETVLFRLLRGSGLLGIGGMAECRELAPGVRLIRPLLSIRRQSVQDYLREHHLTYRVDASNQDLRFTRNRLRLVLLPLLQESFNPEIVDVLCRLATQARELHGEIAEAAAQLLATAELPRAGDMLVFSIQRLVSANMNQVREMFRLVWQREGWPQADMDFERWQRLVEIVHGARPACDFPGKIHVRRVGAVVQIRQAME
jgi:tRNA(Ile)-lysidine synthase